MKRGAWGDVAYGGTVNPAHPNRDPPGLRVLRRLGPIRNYYLGDPEKAKRAAQAVADQLKQGGLEDQFFERIALD